MYDVDKTVSEMQRNGFMELAPGVARAIILELGSGHSHLMGLLEFCQEYAKKHYGVTENPLPAGLWREAERKWDGAQWLAGRKQ